MKPTRDAKRPVMKSKVIAGFLGILAFVAVLPASFAFGQAEVQKSDDQKKDVLRVYVDCDKCNMEFLQKEIAFVNFIKERQAAQVYVLIKTQETPEGMDYELSFSGEKEFGGIQHTLKYTAPKTDGEDAVKQGLARTLKMGLMRYAAKTPVAGRIRIGLIDKVKPTDVVDKWNFWVFSASIDGFFSGQETYNSQSIYGSLTASRVTPGLKVRLSTSASYNRNTFKIEEDGIKSTIKSNSESRSFSGLVVKSIDDHWSVGAYFSAYSSTYQNIKLSLTPAPAIEYDLFPYSESTKRQLRFLYRIGFSLNRYGEETIYLKTKESLLREALEVTLELKRKWGTVSLSLEGSNYLHALKKYRLMLDTEMSIRIFKGLSFNIYGSYSKIKDQLFLARSGASLEEVLLRRRELETDFNYYFSIGFSYSFGSIYSKVVNPRFGSGGRSISIHMGG